MPLTPLTDATASGRAQQLLQEVRKKMGFVPNLLGVVAHAPAVLESYLELTRTFDSTSLSHAECQLMLIAISQRNGCDYCVAAHSTVARQRRVDESMIAAASIGRPLNDATLRALCDFAVAVVSTGGHPPQSDRDAFLAVGYSEAHMLEVVLAVAFKTLSNYTNHLMQTEIDPAFQRAM